MQSQVTRFQQSWPLEIFGNQKGIAKDWSRTTKTLFGQSWRLTVLSLASELATKTPLDQKSFLKIEEQENIHKVREENQLKK